MTFYYQSFVGFILYFMFSETGLSEMMLCVFILSALLFTSKGGRTQS